MKHFLFSYLVLFTLISFTSPHLLAQKIKFGDPMPKDLFVELSKTVNPAVVNINTTTRPRMPRYYRDPLFDFFEQFGGGGSGGFGLMPQQVQPQQALGTGFIIEKEGLIITNNHVIEGADEIRIQLSEKDKKSYPAKVIGRDKLTDIALLKIKADFVLPTVKLGSSDKALVGEWVMAVGNPYGHGHTVTKGIISAKNRAIDEINAFPMIQTDASINPGNSGGPLVNTEGEVIGVNSAVDARAQGIGFAIPIDYVKTVLSQLKDNGTIQRGYLGVLIDNLSPRAAQTLGLKKAEGVLVTHILPDSPAEKAGIKPYDVITAFGDRDIDNAQVLINSIATTPIGSSVKIKAIRNQKEVTLTAKVVESPSEKKLNQQVHNKTFQGKETPFEAGFKVADLTQEMAKEMGLTYKKAPVIVAVQTGTPAAAAGLTMGDLILDVNRQPVKTAVEVTKLLNNQSNVLRIQRGEAIIVVFLQ